MAAHCELKTQTLNGAGFFMRFHLARFLWPKMPHVTPARSASVARSDGSPFVRNNSKFAIQRTMCGCYTLVLGATRWYSSAEFCIRSDSEPFLCINFRSNRLFNTDIMAAERRPKRVPDYVCIVPCSLWIMLNRGEWNQITFTFREKGFR